MNAKLLYERLDRDFALDRCRDYWELPTSRYVCANFRQRHMGLLFDNATEITSVWTAVFPTDTVLERLFGAGAENGLLVLHHPMNWDLRNATRVFSPITDRFYPLLCEQRVAVYVLHTPLDRNGIYSTSVTFATAAGIEPTKDFFEYNGVLVGVIGTTKVRTLPALAANVAKAVGHRVDTCRYGSEEIREGRVAVIGGGGNNVNAHEYLATAGVNVLVTGITATNTHSRPPHDAARLHGINLIGATHYSSEKFACRALVDYFADLDLPATFLEDAPDMADIETQS